MHRRMTAVLTSILGSACGSACARAVAPTKTRGSEHGAPGHGHEQPRPHARHGVGGVEHAFNADAWARVLDDPTRDEWQRPDDVLRDVLRRWWSFTVNLRCRSGTFPVPRLASSLPFSRAVLAHAFGPSGR
jgi:hypothetical protein